MNTLTLTIDCDDFMLALARADHKFSPDEEEDLRRHSLDCESCTELARQLRDQDQFEATPSSPPDPMIGRAIGAYEITELIGTGGMGRVYLALHPEIGSRVAVKVFSKDWNAHPELVSRFFAEARATNVIAHENIVNVLDVGRLEDERPYMVMEYLSGSPLSQLVRKNSISDVQIRQIILDVLSALTAAHARKIIHRDLKPDNIFVSPEGRATLLDFGIAKLIPEIVGDSAPTATGTILGTPHYMSPEQAIGDPVDTRTDVYAMGIILYECFTGQRPFQGNTFYRLLDQHINQIPTPPSSIRPDIEEDVEKLILKAIAKAPSQRYASISAMREELLLCISLTGDTANVIRQIPTLTPLPPGSLMEDTAKTVANGPWMGQGLDDSDETSPTKNVSTGVLAKVGMAAVAVAGVALWASLSPFEGDSALNAEAVIPADATLLAQHIADAASPTDANDLLAQMKIVDAAPPKLPDAAFLRPKPRQVRYKGIKPLSLLGKADQLARQNRGDAILIGVKIYGLNAGGQIELGQTGRSVHFDYYSPKKARSVTSTRGMCVVRVSFPSQNAPTVHQRSGKCSTLIPLSPPHCSMKKLLSKGLKANVFLPLNRDQLIDARMQISTGRSARSYWKLLIHGKSDVKMSGC